jgi:hypothetical protein
MYRSAWIYTAFVAFAAAGCALVSGSGGDADAVINPEAGVSEGSNGRPEGSANDGPAVRHDAADADDASDGGGPPNV